MFRPADLAIFTELLTETSHLPGPILEIGCAGGDTTIFLCNHLDDINDPRRYFCVDTFAGFTDADIEVEVARGKRADDYRHVFRAYRKPWFDTTMRNNGITRVTTVAADASTHPFTDFEEISFCLIDVDLYRPVRHALQQLVPRLAAGGVIVVDDCRERNVYDGALQAYRAVMHERGLPVQIIGNGLGIVRPPRS
jgi:predicted O-methyltransferase YrrM